MSNSVFILTIVTLTYVYYTSGEGRQSGDVCAFIEAVESDVDPHKIICSKNPICQQSFDVTYIRNMRPFVDEEENNKMLRPLEDVMRKCCGSCVKVRKYWMDDFRELSFFEIKDSHFIYPLLGTATITRLHGAYYLPYINVPDMMYITKKPQPRLFESLLDLYPLVLVSIILAALSGFIAWLLETWSNKEEFPRGFVTGWFEGFWWSFISMTTVGYGDKCPRTAGARLFSVIWIFVGIILFSILSGEITGKILEVNSPSRAEIIGKKVGVLHFRDYDAYVVSQNNAKVVRNDGKYEFVEDLVESIRKLRNGTVDGIALDKSTLNLVPWMIEEKNFKIDQLDDVEFLIKDTRAEQLSYNRERFTYGILVHDKELYDYLEPFMKYNRVLVSIEDSYDWTDEKARKLDRYWTIERGSALLFNPSSPYFQGTMIAVGVMIGVILCFGAFYELKRKSCPRRREAEQHL